jgi:lipoate-protein ligase A
LEARLLIDPPTSGVRNMAVDEALLIDAAEHNTATLRFYSWKEPTLSLGYFQGYADREQHPASRTCAIVRRQTGGGAILHDREITYSLVLPATHPLTKQNERLYEIVHQVFVEILSPPNQVLGAARPLQLRSETAKVKPSGEPFLCFQRQSPGDVVFVSTRVSESDATLSRMPLASPPVKILGSAQRRYRGALLQHGSLLLDRSPAAPELAGWRNLGDPNISIETVISTAADQLASALHLRFLKTTLPTELESNASQIANIKYGSPAWTKRR